MPAAQMDLRRGRSRAETLPTQGKDAVMVRNGLFVSLCAVLLYALAPGAESARGEDVESKLRTQLARPGGAPAGPR